MSAAQKLRSESSNDQIGKVFLEYWKLFSCHLDTSTDIYRDLSISDFIKLISMKSARSRGVDIERRLIEKNGWSRVSSRKESGDVLIGHDHAEIKSSILTVLKPSQITLRGFRNWEKVAYYIIVILDVRNYQEDVGFHIIQIPRAVVEDSDLFKPYKESKNARQGQKNIDKGINLDIDGEIFRSWIREYGTNQIKF